jgi:hypothetical protein
MHPRKQTFYSFVRKPDGKTKAVYNIAAMRGKYFMTDIELMAGRVTPEIKVSFSKSPPRLVVEYSCPSGATSKLQHSVGLKYTMTRIDGKKSRVIRQYVNLALRVQKSREEHEKDLKKRYKVTKKGGRNVLKMKARKQATLELQGNDTLAMDNCTAANPCSLCEPGQPCEVAPGAQIEVKAGGKLNIAGALVSEGLFKLAQGAAVDLNSTEESVFAGATELAKGAKMRIGRGGRIRFNGALKGKGTLDIDAGATVDFDSSEESEMGEKGVPVLNKGRLKLNRGKLKFVGGLKSTGPMDVSEEATLTFESDEESSLGSVGNAVNMNGTMALNGTGKVCIMGALHSAGKLELGFGSEMAFDSEDVSTIGGEGMVNNGKVSLSHGQVKVKGALTGIGGLSLVRGNGGGYTSGNTRRSLTKPKLEFGMPEDSSSTTTTKHQVQGYFLNDHGDLIINAGSDLEVANYNQTEGSYLKLGYTPTNTLGTEFVNEMRMTGPAKIDGIVSVKQGRLSFTESSKVTGSSRIYLTNELKRNDDYKPTLTVSGATDAQMSKVYVREMTSAVFGNTDPFGTGTLPANWRKSNGFGSGAPVIAKVARLYNKAGTVEISGGQVEVAKFSDSSSSVLKLSSVENVDKTGRQAHIKDTAATPMVVRGTIMANNELAVRVGGDKGVQIEGKVEIPIPTDASGRRARRTVSTTRGIDAASWKLTPESSYQLGVASSADYAQLRSDGSFELDGELIIDAASTLSDVDKQHLYTFVKGSPVSGKFAKVTGATLEYPTSATVQARGSSLVPLTSATTPTGPTKPTTLPSGTTVGGGKPNPQTGSKPSSYTTEDEEVAVVIWIIIVVLVVLCCCGICVLLYMVLGAKKEDSHQVLEAKSTQNTSFKELEEYPDASQAPKAGAGRPASTNSEDDHRSMTVAPAASLATARKTDADSATAAAVPGMSSK